MVDHHAATLIRSKSPSFKNLEMQEVHEGDNSIKANGQARLQVRSIGTMFAVNRHSHVLGYLPWYCHCQGRAATWWLRSRHYRSRRNILYRLHHR
jgi:hypothetical protein